MQILSAREAIRNHQQNDYNKWNSTKSDPKLASERLLKDIYEPFIVPEFKFNRTDNVFTIGSCFARGLENALSSEKISILSVTNEFDKYPIAGKGITRSGYMNKYNTYAIYYELLWALEHLNLKGEFFIEAGNGDYIDMHTNPTLVNSDFNTTLEKRNKLRKIFSKIKECQMLTITLGLIEVWYDTKNDVYLNMTPGPRLLKKYPERFELRVLDYNENLSVLEKAYTLLLKHNPSLNIVVTVSPIPLQTTFTSKDIVVANMKSKSTLRVVAEAWADLHDNVHYFPSYEMAILSNQNKVWIEDRRHLKGAMTQIIMEIFKKYYLNDYNNWDSQIERFRKKL
jgi:hypothetical protein